MLQDPFSDDLRKLITHARKTALDLGYDYISTIHFLIADCALRQADSLFAFAFGDEEKFLQFRKKYELTASASLIDWHENLPLTKEAEKVLRGMKQERVRYGQQCTYPCYFFLAALKDGESAVAKCFSGDVQTVEKLAEYYEGIGAFTRNQISEVPAAKKKSVLNTIRSLFKSGK